MTLATPRRLMIVVPASLYVFSWFHRVSTAVVAADLMRAFAISAATLGTLAAIYPYVFAAMALVAGSLADTLGPRWTLTGGTVAMGVGAVVFGLAPTFAVAVAGRTVIGFGASVMLIAWLTLASEWFRADEFATISGLTQAIGNVGALFGAAPFAVLVETLGWRHSFVALGAVTLVLAVVAAAVVRDRPAALGLPPVSARPTARVAVSLAATLRGIPAVARNPRTWPPMLAAGCAWATMLAIQGLWGVPYLTQAHDLDRVQASVIVSLLAVGFGVGAPVVGWVSDRWLGRRRPPMIVLSAAYAASWIPLALPWRPPAALLPPLFLAMGLAASGLILVWSCVREVNAPERVGIAVGLCNVPVFLGLAILQWLLGVILDAWWAGDLVAGARVYPPQAYRAAFTLCLAIALSGLGWSFAVTETHCRNIWAR